MVHKSKQRTLLPNLSPSQGGLPTTANTAAGATRQESNVQIRRERYKLTAFAPAVLAANDFGSLKLCDLPNTNLLILGCIVDLDATVTGTGSALANVDLAVGTVATASAAFSNAGEKSVCPKLDCTAGGVIDGSSTATETDAYVAAGSSNALFVNVATGNITTDGAVTLTGTIDVIYLDLGKAT